MFDETMNADVNYYAKAQASQLQAVGGIGASYVPPTKRRNLENKKALLQMELSKVQDALDALDAHPELEAFIDTIQRAG